MIKTRYIDYKDGAVLLEGYLAYDDVHDSKRPVVMVCHDWSGKNEFACQKAEYLAQLGFVGFAIDMFGKGQNGKTKEEKSALIRPFIADRALLQKRIMAAFDTAKKIELVDHTLIAAIGFCFGGLCVLDLARSGADIAAVISFHGLLNPKEDGAQAEIKAKILALHGYDDPMVTPDQIIAFGNEMTHAKADWQLHMYGGVMHAFTNPEAHDSSFGTVYDKSADRRAQIAMIDFFKEVFIHQMRD